MLEVKNKKRYSDIFSAVVEDINSGNFFLEEGIIKKHDHYEICEKLDDAIFLYLVPKDLLSKFSDIKENTPEELFKSSVLAGRVNGRDVRINCFGVEKK